MSDDLEWVKYYGQQAAGCVRHARLMRPQKTISNFEVYAGPDSSVVEKGYPLGHSRNLPRDKICSDRHKMCFSGV